MVTYTLPTPPRRVWLRGFWMTLMGCAGAAMLVLRVLLGPGTAWLWGALALLVLLTAGTVSRRVRRVLYVAWARAADLYARVATRVATRLCYLVISAASGTGSRMLMDPPDSDSTGGASGWVERAESRSEEAYGSQHFQRRPTEGWVQSTVAWARESDNRWYLALVPYLAFLRRVEMRQVRSLGGNIYTLY